MLDMDDMLVLYGAILLVDVKATVHAHCEPSAIASTLVICVALLCVACRNQGDGLVGILCFFLA